MFLKPDLQKRRFGFDLLSLPLAHWNQVETLSAIKRLGLALLQADPNAELTLIAPHFMSGALAEALKSPRVAQYFLPLPSFLPPRIYCQQTLAPLLFRFRKVNQIVSFGQGVPVAYPAPKVLSLLPGQLRDWWKLVPAFMTADAVTVDTLSQKLLLEARVPKMKSRIETVPPAIDDQFHPYPKDAGREVFDRYGVKGRYFLYLGAADASSPCMVAVEAFAKIAHRPRMKSLNAVFAGARGSSIATLRKKIDELGLNHRILVTGELPASELPLWLSNAQFAVCPDAGDDSPLTFLRALSSGCPLIVPSSTLFDAKFKSAVFQCRESDPKVLAEAMTSVSGDSELRDKLVKEGLELLSHQSWERRADSLMRVFDERHQAAGLESGPVKQSNLSA